MFQRFCSLGLLGTTALWYRIHDELWDQIRVSKGRQICPTAAIVEEPERGPSGKRGRSGLRFSPALNEQIQQLEQGSEFPLFTAPNNPRNSDDCGLNNELVKSRKTSKLYWA
jgi:hypothetical protein